MFSNLAQTYISDLDTTMRQIVSTAAEYPPDMLVMLNYALGWVDENAQPYHQMTGKRIRPLLLLLCADAAAAAWQTALPAAAAVELLHNFSLIHDDIQDDSPFRHKRPTVWKIWGRANAINAGDGLLTLAYIALERLSTRIPTPDLLMQAWRIFNAACLELTRGQHLDMRFEHQPTVTLDEYLAMIRGKSAALVAACAQLGALIATGNADLAQTYANFGLNLGLAFQIRDDILGIWGDPAVTGKSAATDILARKKSLPVLYGLSQSDELTEIYRREPFGSVEVTAAVQLLDQIGARDYTQELESRYYWLAVEALERAQPQGQAAEDLKSLTSSLLGRQY